MEPTRLGLESAAAMAAYAKAHARPAAELRLLIINRAPLTTPVAVRQIEERLGWKAVGAIPPAPDEAARARTARKPGGARSPQLFTFPGLQGAGSGDCLRPRPSRIVVWVRRSRPSPAASAATRNCSSPWILVRRMDLTVHLPPPGSFGQRNKVRQ